MPKSNKAKKQETTGTYCALCGGPQYMTPSGICCKNAHGGADSVDSPTEVETVPQDTSSNKPVKDGDWNMDIEMELTPYTGASIYFGHVKVGQLTMVNCPEAKHLIRLLQKVGIQPRVAPYKIQPKGAKSR